MLGGLDKMLGGFGELVGVIDHGFHCLWATGAEQIPGSLFFTYAGRFRRAGVMRVSSSVVSPAPVRYPPPMEARVAVLEQIARTTAATLERLERRFDGIDRRFETDRKSVV